MTEYTRGQLAKIGGVGPETIRFYERQGLLQEPPRTAAGYRQYDNAALNRLRFIRRAKDLGFNLDEIGELLALHDNDHSDRAQVREIAVSKLDEIAKKIDQLESMRAALAGVVAQCSGHGSLGSCPIIHALASNGHDESALIRP